MSLIVKSMESDPDVSPQNMLLDQYIRAC